MALQIGNRVRRSGDWRPCFWRRWVGGSIIMVLVLATADWAAGQGLGSGVTLQLPVYSGFQINTVVAVPDGGTINLGGVSRFGESSVRRGIPLLGAPPVGRLFQNRGVGREVLSSQMQMSVQVLSLEEMDQQVTAEGERRRALRGDGPNGSPEVQRRAQFFSNHVGRGK